MIFKTYQIKVRKVKRRPLFFHLYICSDTESREEKARHGGGFKWITLEKHMVEFIPKSHQKLGAPIGAESSGRPPDEKPDSPSFFASPLTLCGSASWNRQKPSLHEIIREIDFPSLGLEFHGEL
ncbi:hypothetical protein TNCV_3765411 [Trichonephila clavipes]|nr:hypothetical protein TNCV_3765411 [Trichonephila clavipes]